MIKNFSMCDMSNAEYHARQDVGHSSLVKMMRSPAHYRHFRESSHISTPALQFGSAFHMAILEGDLFDETYTISPKFDRRTKAGKQAAEEWDQENLGKLALAEDQLDLINSMKTAIAAHKTANHYLEYGMAEKSFFWTDAETEIECKFRPDFLMVNRDGDIIQTVDGLDNVVAMIDLKSTMDASSDGFARSMAKYGYDMQAAYYSDPLSSFLGRPIPFYFLAVESAAPHGVALYRAGDRTMAIGRSKYRASLQMLQWCRENNSWPGYQPFGEEEEIDVPRWESAVDTGDDDDGA